LADFKLDMTMMFAFHDALRRDLAQVARMETRTEGWDLFERMLHFHHTVEDDALWPVVRQAVAGRSDALALLDDMVSEHAAIGPLLDDLNAALTRGDSAPPARADLAEGLQHHLKHEEEEALPIIDDALTAEQWMAFGQTANERMQPDMPQFLPWLLDGADDDTTTGVLRFIPEPVQQEYQNEWRPAFVAADRWAAKRSTHPER
jgi:iron-sulfur cluster repair protein YtfE (RIC family)